MKMLPQIKLGKRRDDWDVRLVAVSNTLVGDPFKWNVTNCAALVALAVDAMFGVGLYKWQHGLRLTDWRARVYSARRMTRTVLRHIGCVLVDPPYAQRGDILLAYHDGVECAHVCLGLTCLSSSVDQGVHLVSTESVVLAARELEVYRCP